MFVVPELNLTNGFLIFMALSQLGQGVQEATGKGAMKYSKFARGTGAKMSSRVGMFIIYISALVVSAMSFVKKGRAMGLTSREPLDLLKAVLSSRALLLPTLLTLHFAKREAEVLFVHRYSGTIDDMTAYIISIGYATTAGVACWFASTVHPHVYASLGGPLINLPLINLPVSTIVVVGLALYVIGQIGNGYHHLLLRLLRDARDAAAAKSPRTPAAKTRPTRSSSSSAAKKGKASSEKDAAADAAVEAPVSQDYAIPTGGLFPLVTCPHYLFEIIAWAGMALVAQHLYMYCAAASMTSYLAGRAYATRRWYRTKFDDYPASRKCMVPFLF